MTPKNLTTPNEALCGCGRLPKDCTGGAKASAEHWLALAATEERSIAEGWCLVPSAATARATSYRAVAKALFLEADTGLPHCSRCFKPTHRPDHSDVATCRCGVLGRA